MREIRTEDAVGHVLCHDITQIIPGVIKDAKFKKGHVVTEEDIPVLLSLGKEHLYVWEKDESKYHENEAAEILCGLCRGDYMERSGVKEGKIELTSTVRGLLKIDTELLDRINGLGEMMIASRHNNTPVEPGDKLCGTRIIPLVIEKEKMEEAVEVCGGKKIFTILPYQKKKVGIVTTGSEVYHGRIKDAFGPVLKEKVKEFGGEVMGQTITADNPEHTRKAILEFIAQGAWILTIRRHSLSAALERVSYRTEHLCFRAPCSCLPTMKRMAARYRWQAFQAASCTPGARCLTWCFRASWRMIP